MKRRKLNKDIYKIIIIKVQYFNSMYVGVQVEDEE